MINSKDISFVVQGPINKTETPKCLKSIRKYFPDAEIILSTWKDADVENIDYDILVKSDAPGAEFLEKKSYGKIIYNNMNRQLLSTKEGLKKANRKYTFKLRSDLIFADDRILNYFDKFPKRTGNYNLFKHKILTATLFTRFNYKGNKNKGWLNIPFHISDWWHFGLTEDLKTYFMDTPLAVEPEFTGYFALKENKDKISPYGKLNFKFAPEQYFGYECFARNFKDIYMEDASDCDEDIMKKFRECLINNFIILEFKQSGLYLNKYPYSKNEKFSGDQYINLYNYYRYEKEYKKLCDSNYIITTNGRLYEDEDYGLSLLRIYKHLVTLTNLSTPFIKRLEQLFISIPSSIISFIFIILKERLRRKQFDKKEN